jgi:CRP-like cAMP-binding protein
MSNSDEKQAAFIEGNSVSPEELHAKYGIPKDEIEAFRHLIRIYSNQDLIIEEAAKDKAMYVLRFGTVKVFRRSGTQQKIMGTMDAVTVFGELSAINDEPRSATVIAMTDKVLVYRIDNPSIHQIVANPAWAELLISQLSRTLARSIEQHIAAWQQVKELRAEVERLSVRKA